MIEPTGSSSQTSYYGDRRANTDSASVSQPGTQRGSQADEDTPIRQASQASEDSGLDPEDQQKLRELKRRDQEVRAHEQAHISAGGRYITRRAQFQYQTGPDGQRYAVGGEVGIDTSPVPGDPQATIRKAQAVAQAALAPADPSVQDRTVAADARQMITKARIEQARLETEQRVNEQRQESGLPARSATSEVSLFSDTATLAKEPEINLDEVV